MKSTLDLSTIDIPYGVLHDQRLNQVRREDNKLIFTFDIEIYPQDYTNDFYKPYLNYKHCDMLIELDEEKDYVPECEMQSGVNDKDKFKGLVIKQDIVELINNASNAEFIGCLTDGFSFEIKLFISFYKSKGEYKKYKNYNSLNISLYPKKVEWNWY